MIYRNRKGFNDVKKYVKTINPDLPGQAVQKGYFKDAIEEWKEGGYSAEDIQAWNLYARVKRKKASGFNMFTKYKIGADVESKAWKRLTNCNIYDVTGAGFKVDIKVEGDHSGKLYYGTSKLYMVNEVPGVFSVDKYTFDVTGLSMLTNYYFYIKNTRVNKGGRTGIYSQKTVLYTPIIIDIGSDAIDRTTQWLSAYTVIDYNNPANATGKIHTIELWCAVNMSDVRVGIFYKVGANWSTRDYYSISGTVVAGAKRIYPVDLNVEIGDYIGIYNGWGNMELSTFGGGYCHKSGIWIPCTNQSFGYSPNRTLSLGGIGLA